MHKRAALQSSATCLRFLTLTLIFAWGATAAPAAVFAVPEFTLQRYAELTALVRAENRDTLVTPLLLASDDPADWAAGEKMILNRIAIERTNIAFMKLDIILAFRLFEERFSPAGREIVREYILKEISPGSAEYGNRFVHANDNWPFVACYLMILGGEATGREDLANEAVLRLETYLDMNRLLGVGSEYNSPTYNPLSLFCVEAIAGLSQNLRARVVARVIAERLWSEIALRFHAPSSQFGAPHSRAYYHDTLGIGSGLFYSLYPHLPGGVLLDRESFPNLAPSLTTVSEESLIRHFLDPHLVRIAETKRYPWLVQARKYRPFRLEGEDTWPGGFFDTVTFQTSRFSVGSTQRTYAGGNGTTPFQVHWSVVPRATRPGDARTLFTRYRVNDTLPDPQVSGVYREEGYIHGLQHRNTALVLYRPKLGLNGTMRRLCASALVPRPDRLEAVYVGSPPRKVETWPVSRPQPEPVFLQDQNVYLAIHPLEVTDRGRAEGMRLEQAAEHLILSYYNLQADQDTTWDQPTFLDTRNGFVVEVGDREEYGSFEEFVRQVGTPEIHDTLAEGVRSVSYTRPGRSLVVSQRVATHEYLSRKFDGQEYEGPLLASPVTVASLGATLQVGDARLESAAGEPKWLTAEPGGPTYVVLYPFRWTFPLRLVTPHGEIRSEGFRMGRVYYEPGPPARLVVDCERAPRPLLFTRPAGPFQVILNDEDVTAQVTATPEGLLQLALPGNDHPEAMHAELEVEVTPAYAALAEGKNGALTAVVHNRGTLPARELVVLPFHLGFARNLGAGDQRLAELPPGESARFGWGITGSPLGISAGAQVTVSSANAPTAVGLRAPAAP